MLSDRGLQTPEQIKEHNEYLHNRANGQWHGCVGSRICESCNHLISDSICLCIGIFTCPNCGFENGQYLKRMFQESQDKFVNNSPIRLGTNGIVSTSFSSFIFDISKKDVLNIIDKYTNPPNIELIKKRNREIMNDIPRDKNGFKLLIGITCNPGFHDNLSQYLQDTYVLIKDEKSKPIGDFDFRGIPYYKVNGQAESKKYWYDKDELNKYLEDNKNE